MSTSTSPAPSQKIYRVALSYAGETRDFVSKVARILANRFGEDKILYDKFHEAEFANPDLAFNLPELYREQSDLIVTVLCPDYKDKDWCGLEWRAIYAHIKEGNGKMVMLTRFQLVDGKGLFGLGGFIDLDKKTPAQAAKLIFERLARNEGRPKSFYTSKTSKQANSPTRPDWPMVAPSLDWPVADHTKAQQAFAQLIVREAKFRLLPIYGHSETGKSHLTKQFHRNALKIPGLTCGRFDFKGAAGMDKEVQSFADHLEAAHPAPNAVLSQQLSAIFTELKAKARPTLLIFDTFDSAGDAGKWIENSLLMALVRAPWLRVAIVGKSVCKPHEETWRDFSSPAIELRTPTPEEWHVFGKLHRPQVTLEFVREAYEYCGGKGSTLAQLLGPPA